MSETDLDKIIGQITRRLLVILFPAFILTFGSVFAYDHFALKNKVDRDIYEKNYFDIVLLIEAKNRTTDELAKANAKDVIYMKDRLDKLDKIQAEIDKFLRDTYRVRGFRDNKLN